MQEGLVAGAAIAFLLGWWTQNMQLCMLTFGASTLLVALVSTNLPKEKKEGLYRSRRCTDTLCIRFRKITVPAWPIYTKHAVEWLPNTSTSSEGSEADSATAASADGKTSTKKKGTGKTNTSSAAS